MNEKGEGKNFLLYLSNFLFWTFLNQPNGLRKNLIVSLSGVSQNMEVLL